MIAEPSKRDYERRESTERGSTDVFGLERSKLTTSSRTVNREEIGSGLNLAELASTQI